jgi:hypothetical protein
MVLNQGQLFIVVYDWESYLGSPFSLVSVLVIIFVSGTYALLSFTVVSLFCWQHSNKGQMYVHHAAPWSPSDDGRDTYPL